jgi:PPOX class probable F420-dependent enzyme
VTSLLSPAGEDLLNAGRIAHLVTLEPDGAPQVSCVWVGLDDGEVVFASMAPRRKIDNIRRDERVSLSIESGHRNDYGLDEYLVLHGRARVVDGGGRALLQHLAHTYLGADVVFPDPSIPGDGMVVRIAIGRVGGVGPWTP